ncbi:MAG: HAD family phosphatase [Betaproteobacteria bacterium]|nr:HAD family phosphatase [Betaproteobacteria bacterium]NBT68887.1 HAD family phosphatase [Betaproteobacteria bacterium]
MKTLAIFDLDGVLVDACEWHRIALNLALKRVSNYFIPDEEHFLTYNGLPTKTKLKMLVEKKCILEEDIELISIIKQEETLKTIEANCLYDYEKNEALHYLSSRAVRIACVTNSIRDTAMKMLKKSGLASYIDLLISNEDVHNNKPSLDGYDLCLEKFKASKEECVVFEDLQACVDSAKLGGYDVRKIANHKDITLSFIQEIF